MDGLVIQKNCTFIRKEKKIVLSFGQKKKKLYSGVKTRTPPGYEMGGPLLRFLKKKNSNNNFVFGDAWFVVNLFTQNITFMQTITLTS